MTHIQQRRDDSAVWTSENPILFDGEAGHEEDTGRWKMGDGVTAWTALPYKSGVDSINGETGTVTGYAKTASPAFTGNPTAPTPPTSDDDTSLATTEFVKNVIAEAMLTMYQVGDIKMSTSNVNPGTYMGGTWAAWGSGRVPVGVDAAQTEFNTVEETGGAKTHALTAAENGPHTHTGPAHTHTGPAHVHSGPSHFHGDGLLETNTILYDPQQIIPDAANSYSAAPGFNAVAGWAAHSPRISNVDGSTGAAGTGDTGSSGTGATSSAGTGATGSSGTGDAHNNLQPYITCYMFKRTA